MNIVKIKKISLIVLFMFLCISFVFISSKIVESATIININNKFKYITSANYKTSSNKVGQSFCKVGKYYVCAIINPEKEKTANTILSVINADTGKVVNTINCYKFGHANGMTYNPDNGNIYIAQWSADLNSQNKISYFPANLITSKDSKKIKNSVKSITLPYKAASIEYDSYSKRYITNTYKKVCIYDENFNYVSSFLKENTNQDICVYKGLILAADYDSTEKYASKIYVYSANGAYKTVLGTNNTNKIDNKKVTNGNKKIEIESMEELGNNKLAVFFYGNTTTYGNPIFSLSFDFNKYITGSAKYQIVGLNQNKMKGINFSIYQDINSNGSIDSKDKKLQDISTDENGSITLANLKYGKYIAKLNSSVVGYEAKDIITSFNISYDGQVVNKEIRFIPKTYIVNYNGNMNTNGAMTPSTFEYDKQYSLKTNSYSKKHKITYDLRNNGGNIKYTFLDAQFKGWNMNPDSTEVLFKENQKIQNIVETGRVELYAVWELKSAILPKVQKEGYACIGWTTNKNSNIPEYRCGEKVIPAGDIVLYPVFVEGEYIVEYDGNGSTDGSMGITLHEVGKHAKLEKNKYLKKNVLTLNYNYGDYEKEEHELEANFKYWNSRVDDSGEKYSDEESVIDIIDNSNKKIILYAQWNLPTIILPKLERDEYECIGWNTYENATEAKYKCNETYQVPSDIELYAVWESKTYEVKYNGNGETSGEVLNSKHEREKTAILSNNTFKKEHELKLHIDDIAESIIVESTFKHWNTEQDGTGTSYFEGETVSNLSKYPGEVVNLYAIWDAGEVILNKPIKDQYECIGWSINQYSQNPEYKCGEKVKIDRDITLYAIFAKKENPYSLNVNINLIDSETKKPLEDAIFKVYEFNKEDNKYYEYCYMSETESGVYKTDTILEYTDNNNGEFKIIEDKAPYGYYGNFEENSIENKKEYKVNIVNIIESGKYNNQDVQNKSEITLKEDGKDIENTRVKGDIILDVKAENEFGDATLAENKWGLYKDGILIDSKILNNEKIIFTNLELGQYSIKELESGDGFIEDKNEYRINIEYEDEKTKNVLVRDEISKNVKKQSLQIINEDSIIEETEKSVYKAYLISDLNGMKEKNNKSSDKYNFDSYNFNMENENYKSSMISDSTYEIKDLAYGKYVVIDDSYTNKTEPFIINITEDSDNPQIWKVASVQNINENNENVDTEVNKNINTNDINVSLYTKAAVENASELVGQSVIQEENYQYASETSSNLESSTQKLDLSIESYISEIQNINNSKTTNINTGFTKATSQVVKTDIKAEMLDESEIIVKYNIKISNNGDCEGYIGKIIDYIPEELSFKEEDNKEWKQISTVRLENDSLYGYKIKPRRDYRNRSISKME